MHYKSLRYERRGTEYLTMSITVAQELSYKTSTLGKGK